MSVLEKIQKLPQPQKIKLIWIVSGVIILLLVVVWVLSYRVRRQAKPDTTLFESLGQEINDVKNNYGK